MLGSTCCWEFAFPDGLQAFAKRKKKIAWESRWSSLSGFQTLRLACALLTVVEAVGSIGMAEIALKHSWLLELPVLFQDLLVLQ